MKEIKNKEFISYKLNEKGINQCNEVAYLFDEFLVKLRSILPESRELSIVKTKLEEASFFMKKGVSTQEINQRQNDEH